MNERNFASSTFLLSVLACAVAACVLIIAVVTRRARLDTQALPVEKTTVERLVRLPHHHPVWNLRFVSFYCLLGLVTLATLAVLALLFMVALDHATLPTSVLCILSAEVLSAGVGMFGTVITGLWRGRLPFVLDEE